MTPFVNACLVVGVLVGLFAFCAFIVEFDVGEVVFFGLPGFFGFFGLLGLLGLRWVRGLLPGDEGTAWLAEVGSCLAEAHDKGERRRYVRSYCRGVPQLIWTSWTEHLRASRQRELL